MSGIKILELVLKSIIFSHLQAIPPSVLKLFTIGECREQSRLNIKYAEGAASVSIPDGYYDYGLIPVGRNNK